MVMNLKLKLLPDFLTKNNLFMSENAVMSIWDYLHHTCMFNARECASRLRVTVASLNSVSSLCNYCSTVGTPASSNTSFLLNEVNFTERVMKIRKFLARQKVFLLEKARNIPVRHFISERSSTNEGASTPSPIWKKCFA